MTKQSEIEKGEAITYLRSILHPGDTVYTSLNHVSRSGMYRVINLYVIKDNQPVRIDWAAAKLLEGYDSRHDGCKAGGCGMDMGFHLVHNLGYALWPNGFTCTGKACPSNDHFNGDPNYDLHPHKSGGYALHQKWM